MKLFRTIFTNLFLIIFLLWLSGCSEPKQVKSKKINSIQTVMAKELQMVEMIETTGDVVAKNTVTLRAAVEGLIKFCPWREGDIVEKTDQTIIEISRPLYQQQLAVAQAELDVKIAIFDDLKVGPRPEEITAAESDVIHLESCTKFAKIDLDRIKNLADKNVISKQDREKAQVNYIRCKTQLEGSKDKLSMLKEGTKKTLLVIASASVLKARANVALAQAKVNECILRAPFAGIITEVFVRPGDLTHLSSPRMPLLKMMDPKSLIVRAGLPESSAANLKKGTSVIVRLDAYPNKKLKAVVERVHPRIEWSSRTRIVEIRINDPVELIPRMFARVSVQGRVIEDAIVVPEASIITTPRGEHVVFVVVDQKAVKRIVEIGLEKGSDVQIIKGVNRGEMVVIAGNLNLKNGTFVKTVK